MTEPLNLLDKRDAEHLMRQIAVFSLFRPALISLIGVSAILSGVYWVGIFITVVGVVPLVNALRWKGRVMELIERGRPLRMKVFFSKYNPFSPFQDLKASLYDPRRYDPFGQMFKPCWRLLGVNWKADPIIGDAQECLAYVDRETGKLYAFATSSGALYVKPYVLLPWRKLDVPALLSSGEASNAELSR